MFGTLLAFDARRHVVSWGQDCIIRFTMYGRSSPDEKLIKIQSSDNNNETYLFKHGNGFQVSDLPLGILTHVC